MNRNLEQLVELQAADLEVRRFRAGLDAAPKRVAVAEKAQADAASAQSAALNALATEEDLRRKQESGTVDYRSKIARLRRQMDAAVSSAQVDALEHEISFAESAIATLEDEELSSMERSELLESSKFEAGRLLLGASGVLDRERRDAADLTETSRAGLIRLEVERKSIRSGVDADILSVYDRVAKSRGTGIAEAADGKCSACQMKLRPQRWNDLTAREHADDLFTCESCGRILFWDRQRDAPGSWPTGDRLKSALTGGKT